MFNGLNFSNLGRYLLAIPYVIGMAIIAFVLLIVLGFILILNFFFGE